MTQTTSPKSDRASTLLAIHMMRMNSAYREAEFLRRKSGAKAMVAKKDSKDYAAVVLLIGTWNAIGSAVRLSLSAKATAGNGGGGAMTPGQSEQEYLDAIFESVPICHMYSGLMDALKVIEKDWGVEYAPDFQWLYDEYQKWLKTAGKDEKYRTAHCKGGIRAFFG